jgi:hypothetical protein
MKRQKSCGPRLGKLVHQLPGVVTFAYDLRFRRMIARWKGIIEEIHFGGSIMPLAIIENLDLEKPSFRPSKWPRKLKPAKNSKLPKLPENCFEPVGKGGWPPISTWINCRTRCIIQMGSLARLVKSRRFSETLYGNWSHLCLASFVVDCLPYWLFVGSWFLMRKGLQVGCSKQLNLTRLIQKFLSQVMSHSKVNVGGKVKLEK